MPEPASPIPRAPRPEAPPTFGRSAGLVDVLDRVLDKGLLVAGDIKVSLAEVELLTIRIRLIVCSVDKAAEIGLDWWRHDRYFAPGKGSLLVENEILRRQVRALERRVAALDGGRRGRSRGRRSPRAATGRPTGE
jgi:Gas vesicle protein